MEHDKNCQLYVVKLNRLRMTSLFYAEYMYNTLKQEYDIKETETREQLAKTVNTIFKKIYNGGFSLSLDAKYNIILTADGRSIQYLFLSVCLICFNKDVFRSEFGL